MIDDDLTMGANESTPTASTISDIIDWCNSHFSDVPKGKQLTEEALGRILYDLEKITDHCDVDGWRLAAIKEAAERIEAELIGGSTPTVYPHVDFAPPVMPVDDSDEPITGKWWLQMFHSKDVQLNSTHWLTFYGWQDCPMLRDEHSTVSLTGCKTRGDLRTLCRLLGVQLK